MCCPIDSLKYDVGELALSHTFGRNVTFKLKNCKQYKSHSL